ncbi:hypothetical protein [Pyrobaculum aerophilum]|nr:hypothetical protein [Pyrobaculum aerophilum]
MARYSRVFLESERRAVAIRPEEGGCQRAEVGVPRLDAQGAVQYMCSK